MDHSLSVRVYYEDVDLAGIVYYANYLKFIERGRSEWIRALGIDQAALKEATGGAFAVRRLSAEYLAPARFDDLLEVATQLTVGSGARLILEQKVRRDGRLLFSATVTLAFLSSEGRALRLPEAVARVLPRR
jgi:acyl-CoA thioester hydrolase